MTASLAKTALPDHYLRGRLNIDWCWHKAKYSPLSNEITAIPALLELLVIIGCIVTLNAMGRFKSIAALLFSRRKPATSLD